MNILCLIEFILNSYFYQSKHTDVIINYNCIIDKNVDDSTDNMIESSLNNSIEYMLSNDFESELNNFYEAKEFLRLVYRQQKLSVSKLNKIVERSNLFIKNKLGLNGYYINIDILHSIEKNEFILIFLISKNQLDQ